MRACVSAKGREVQVRAGEMAHRLRVLAVLPEDLCSIPSTHMTAYNCLVTPVPGDPAPPLILRAPGMYTVQRHHTGKIHVPITNNNVQLNTLPRNKEPGLT